MKTIVVLDNIFSADIVKDFEFLKKNLNINKFNIISPLMFILKDGKYNLENFTIRLIASSISLGNMYNDFGTIKSIIDQNKTTIYFGMAHTNVKADEIYVINKISLDTQESLLDNYLKESNVKFNYIKSSQAKKDFSNVEKLVEFLNDLQQ
jgi:hypothetical protein